MAELISEILLTVLGWFLEFFLELVAELFLDWLSRLAAESLRSRRPAHPILSSFAWAFLGALLGAISLAFFPHPWFHRSRFPGISLVLSPLAAGAAMSAIGALLRRRGKPAVQIESFPYAFAFALGMALIRFVGTR